MKTTLVAILVVLGPLGFPGGSSGGAARDDSFSLTGIRKLVVDGSFFTVDVAGHSGTAVEAAITLSPRLRSRGVKVIHEQRGLELHVRVERPLFSISVRPGETAMMEFSIPRDTELQVSNSSGSVGVTGLTAGVDLEVSSGRIHVKDVTATITANSSSGNITIEACRGRKKLEASSGTISVLSSSGDVVSHTSSGAHIYTSIKGSITAESSSGGMTLTDTEGTLDLRSSSGSHSGTDVTVTGDSSFRTSSGAIDFDFTNSIDDFTFDLRSSSGTISVEGTRAEGTVKMGSGVISIKGNSSSGRQTYK